MLAVFKEQSERGEAWQGRWSRREQEASVNGLAGHGEDSGLYSVAQEATGKFQQNWKVSAEKFQVLTYTFK